MRNQSFLNLNSVLRILGVSFLVGLPVLTLQAQEPGSDSIAHIAFIADETNPFAAETRALVQQELLALVREDFDVHFSEDLVITIDDTVSNAVQLFEQLISDQRVAMVITQGFFTSQIAIRGVPWPKPVIASSVFDARLEGFPNVDGTSGVENLTYIAPPPPGPVIRDLTRFQELTNFSQAAILIDERFFITFAEFIDQLLESASELGITLEPVPVGTTAQSGLDALPDGVEAVYISPLPRLAPEEFELLAKGLAARRLPSFSYSADDVSKGIMGSLGAADLTLRARRIALNAYRILLGDDAKTLPVTLIPDEKLILNMRTVRELGILLAMEETFEAQRLFDDPEDLARNVTLRSAMEDAMSANLSLAIEQQEVRAGAEDIRLARSRLLPSIDASLTGATVSEGLAESSFGLQPRHNVDGAINFQQLIFSAEASANVSAQKSIQESLKQNLNALGLDVGLEAAEAYLNVLRSKTLEQVQQDNLDLTLASVRMARQRERIGAAGPGERLRLESELSRRRADRIDAFARRSAAEIALNQIMNRPLDEKFLTPESGLEGRALLEGTLATSYLSNFTWLDLLNDFLVESALSVAPEIQSLDAAIAAQERILASIQQTYYLPTIGLQGNLSTNVLREEASSQSLMAPGGVESPDFPWTAGLSINLPLFQGNSRSARRSQATATLIQLELQRDLVAQRIEQNVRTQLHFAKASLTVVRESEAAARTAQQALELVTEAYGQGLVNVVSLLEAQTNALLSERNVTNAIFDYLINLKRVERAFGQFEIFSTPDEQIEFARLLEEYIRNLEEPS